MLMKKILLAIVIATLSFSAFVAVKVSSSFAEDTASPVEALSSGESDVYCQTMGYCSAFKLTYKCVRTETSELCRIYQCLG